MSFVYKNIVRPGLFLMDPENAHRAAAFLGKNAAACPLWSPVLRYLYSVPASDRLKTEIAGISFPNPVGMAAGFDKTGELYTFLSLLGFGFVESGTFTAHGQPGNPRPRIFRFPSHEALLNRMGFNNPGSQKGHDNLSLQKRTIPLGVNIGKSKITPIEEAAKDYLQSLLLFSGMADYIAINISSPNTPGLRTLHHRESLQQLLKELKNASTSQKNRPPLFLKIAPDLTDAELDDVLDASIAADIGGIIISNTTLSKSQIPRAAEMEGGLSGAPLRDKSTQMIGRVFKLTGGKLAIIGVGGIFSGAHALEKIKAGASLIQIYTGLIYEGLSLPGEICRYLNDYCEKENLRISEIVGAGHG